MTADEVLAIKDVAELRRLTLADFAGREMTLREFAHIAGLCDGFWMHDGNPQMPHAILTSGLCSNGFIDSLRFLEYPNLAQIMASMLHKRVLAVYDGPVDWVIGSSYAAITFSYELARCWGAIHGFTEKIEVNEQKMVIPARQVWRRRFIPEGEIVMQGEELATTQKTSDEVRQAVLEGNVHPVTKQVVPVTFAPVLALLIDRSVKGIAAVGDSRVASLFRVEGIWALDATECPLCAQGSPRVKPKLNWDYLIGRRAAA